MIEIKNLKKSFDGNVIFDNVNFKIEKGDSVVIIGGSGCGKSTLLRCLNRLITPDTGEIIFEGKNILDKDTDIDAYRQKVGMVYQSFNLFSHLNVMENMILAPMKVLGMGKKEAMEKAEGLLRKVAMDGRKFQMPSMLSGGQKQRVAIARTLMMDPEVILFDEPTSALDPTMVYEVESVIASLVQGGMTSVIVTHEMRFAEKIANKVIFLAEKGIYDTGSPEVIFNNPAKELTRQFIYNSRMFTTEVTEDDIDYLDLASSMRSFVYSYGCTNRQSTSIDYVAEEIIYRAVKFGNVGKCVVMIICEDKGSDHRIIINFPELDRDPLSLDCYDEIGLRLLGGYCREFGSEVNGNGNWEIRVSI